MVSGVLIIMLILDGSKIVINNKTIKFTSTNLNWCDNWVRIRHNKKSNCPKKRMEYNDNI